MPQPPSLEPTPRSHNTTHKVSSHVAACWAPCHNMFEHSQLQFPPSSEQTAMFTFGPANTVWLLSHSLKTLVSNYQNAKLHWLAISHTPARAKHIINLPQSSYAYIWLCKSDCKLSTNSPCVCCTSCSITRGTPACPSPTPPATAAAAAAAVPHPPATPANPRPHCLIDITGVRAGPGAAPWQSRGSGPFCASTSIRDQHCPSVSTNHCYASCTRYSCVSLPCSSAKDALPDSVCSMQCLVMQCSQDADDSPIWPCSVHVQ